jgi:hypothetical protein
MRGPKSGAEARERHSRPGISTFFEVFSPGIRTQLQGAVDAAGQPPASRQRLRARLLGTGSRQATFDTPPAHGADLQRCLSNPSVDGESW